VQPLGVRVAIASPHGVAMDGSAKKQGFLGRTIPLLLLSCLLGFLGVLAVDTFIEHRQVTASTRVAASTISTTRRMGEFAVALERDHATAASGSPDESSRRALLVQRDHLAEAIREFDQYVDPDDRATWQGSSDRTLALEGSANDLIAMAGVVERSGLSGLARAERQHTLHGVLEGSVLFLMSGASLVLLLVWRQEEARARQHDAAVEEQLRRALGELDAFAGRLAHDLRSPLQPILTGSQSIERAPVSDTVRRQAERIERAAKRLGRLVEAVLQFTRASVAGATDGEQPHAHVNAAVQAIASELEEMAQARGGHVATDLGPDVTLPCAEEVVQSLVWNLVDNALKYGVKEGTPPSVTVRTGVERDLGVIEVEDRGPGVPPEVRERVFQPLFRGQRGGEGLGLGLSIVERVVTTLGGHVELRGGKEDGALFRILVPIDSAEATGGRSK